MRYLFALALGILTVLAVTLPGHRQWLDNRTGTGTGQPYSYGQVECGHNDLCLGA